MEGGNWGRLNRHSEEANSERGKGKRTRGVGEGGGE